MIPDIIVNGGNITVRPIPDNNNINVRMRNVRDIRVINTGVREIADNRIWLRQQPNAIPQNVPVTTRIGTPIVNMPGCVKAHKENAENPANKNKMLVDNDPEGNIVLCDGGMPYFQPPDYDYRDLSWRTIYGDAPVAEGIDTGEPPPPPNTPDTPGAPTTPPTTKEDVPCPPANARREGDLNQAGTEKVTGYELQRDPNNYEQFICVTLWEDISFAERYLPSVNVLSLIHI